MFEERNVTRMLGSYLAYKDGGTTRVGKCVYASVVPASNLDRVVEGLLITANMAGRPDTPVSVIGNVSSMEKMDRPEEKVAMYGVVNPSVHAMAVLVHDTDEPVFRWMPKPAWSMFVESRMYKEYVSNNIARNVGAARGCDLLPMVHIMYNPARQWSRSYNKSIITLAGAMYNPSNSSFFVVEELEKYFPRENAEQEIMFDEIVFGLAGREAYGPGPYSFYHENFGAMSSPTRDTLFLQVPNEGDTYDIYYSRIKVGQSIGGELRLSIPRLEPAIRQAMANMGANKKLRPARPLLDVVDEFIEDNHLRVYNPPQNEVW